MKGISGQMPDRGNKKATGDAFRKKLLEGSARDIGNRKRTTDASFHDRGAIDSYLDQVVNAIGEKWNYKTYKGEDGQASTHPYFDHDVGDMVYPDEKGDVRYMNKDYLMKMQEIEDYIEDKVDYIMKIAIKSKELCKDVLNLNEIDYNHALAPASETTQGPAVQKSLHMGKEMQELDARIDSIKATPAGSAKQVEKLSKLRTCVKALRDRFVMKDLRRELSEAKKLAGPRTGNELTEADDKKLNRTIE
jgi:hypothetical protein